MTHKPQHDGNNPPQNNYEPKETPVWRIVLSIAVTIFLVGRLAYTCSGMKDKNAQNQNTEFQQMMQETQARYEEDSRQRMTEAERISNNIMYTEYNGLEQLAETQKAAYKIMKVEKDSLMRFDISTKLKIGKNSYFQRNFDDSLKMAIKTPEDMTVFIHDYLGKGDMKYNFINLKRSKKLTDFKAETTDAAAKTFSYAIEHDGKKFNGYAICFQNDGHFCFVEFESDKIKKETLRLKALAYLISNLENVK